MRSDGAGSPSGGGGGHACQCQGESSAPRPSSSLAGSPPAAATCASRQPKDFQPGGAGPGWDWREGLPAPRRPAWLCPLTVEPRAGMLLAARRS